MDEHLWQLIDEARFDGKEDDAAVCEALIRKLGICDHDGLDNFEAFFTEQIAALDTPAVRESVRQFWTLNDESWLYLRAWLVSRGSEFFNAARTGPKMAMEVVASYYPGLFNVPNGERFLQCATKARERLGPGEDMRN